MHLQSIVNDLQDKLRTKESENNRLRRHVKHKESEIIDLQKTCDHRSNQIADLEKQCGNLSEQRMEKNIMDEERAMLKQHNVELSQKLQKAISSIETMRRERETVTRERGRNSKMLMQIEDIVRFMDHISINYDKNQSLKENEGNRDLLNVKRKIEAMEYDRQRMMKECKDLYEENEFKDARISSLESKLYDRGYSEDVEDKLMEQSMLHAEASNQVDRLQDQLEKATAERDALHKEKRKLKEKNSELSQQLRENRKPKLQFRSRRGRVDRDEESVSSSDSSTIDPPHISLEEYEEIKREYEKTLRDMVNLSEELKKAKQELRRRKHSAGESEQEFNDYSEEYKDSLLQISDLKRNLSRIEKKYKQSLSESDEMKNTYESRLADLSNAYETLEEKFNKLKNEQNQKLEILEKEVCDSERLINDQRRKMEEDHRLKMKDSQIQIEADMQRFEDLRLKYESLVGDHRSVNEELMRLSEKYDKSLKTIVQLEDGIKQEREHTKQAELQISDAAESKYQKLKAEYQTLISAKRSSDSSEAAYRKKIEEDCSALQRRLEETQRKADAKYDELHGCYKLALLSIDELENKLASGRYAVKKPRSKYEIAFDRISDLEKDLDYQGSDRLKEESPSIESADTTYETEKDVVVEDEDEWEEEEVTTDEDVEEEELITDDDSSYDDDRQEEERSTDDEFSYDEFSVEEMEMGLQPFFDFLQHQRRMQLVHCDLLYYGRNTRKNEEDILESSSTSSVLFDSLFLDEDKCVAGLKPDGENESNETKTIIKRLQSKVSRIKLLAIAAKVRYQAREKERKIVFLHYRKILHEYNVACSTSSTSTGMNKKNIDQQSSDQTVATEASTNSSMTPSETETGLGFPESNRTIDNMTLELQEKIKDDTLFAKVKGLEEDLKAAQMQVEKVSQEVKALKQEADDAQQEQEQQENNLRILLAQHKEVEEEIIANQESQRSSPKLQQVGMTGLYLRRKHEHDWTIGKLAIVKRELSKKKKEANDFKEKLNAREEELREMINRYKELHKEYNELLARHPKENAIDKSNHNSIELSDRAKLIQERDSARWKVTKLEEELTISQESASAALAKQALAKQHLRDVIFQYKTLEHEHSSLVQKVEGLRGSILPDKEPSYTLESAPPTPLVRQVQSRDSLQQSNRHADDQSSVASQSITSRSITSQISKSGRKKIFAKEIYKQMKHNVRKRAQKEVKRLKL